MGHLCLNRDLESNICITTGTETRTKASLKIISTITLNIGVRAGGARGAAAPPKFGQLRFFGQQEKTWAKPVFKDVSMFIIIIIF